MDVAYRLKIEDKQKSGGSIKRFFTPHESSPSDQIGNIASNGPLGAGYRLRPVIGTGSSVSCNGLETQTSWHIITT